MRIRLGAVLCLVALGGCSSHLSNVIANLTRPAPQYGSDIPAAKPLGPETSRKLFLLLVEGLHQQGKSRAALAYLGAYEAKYPGDHQAMQMRAACLVDVQQYAEAKALYAALLDGDGAASAYAGLGRIAAAGGDWSEAAANFRLAALRDTANIAYLNDLGYAQLAAGRYDEALSSLRQASELAPDDHTIRDNLILGLHLAGRDAEASAMVDHISQPEDQAQAAGLLRLSAADLRPPQATATAAATGPAQNLAAAPSSEESAR